MNNANSTSDENREMADVPTTIRLHSEVHTRQNQRCRLLVKTRDATVSERQTFCYIQRSHSATTSAQRRTESSIANRYTESNGTRSATHKTHTIVAKR